MADPIRFDGYDYDGGTQAEDEEGYALREACFGNPKSEPSEEERLLLEEEAEYQSKLDYESVLAEEERERANIHAQENEPLNYDHDADPCGYYDIYPDDVCPDCHMHADDTYDVSANHIVCECSPLYPDLRPDDLRSSPPCSCNVVRCGFLGTSICSCTSPDLYALLERKHILFHGHKPEPLNQPTIDHHPF